MTSSFCRAAGQQEPFHNLSELCAFLGGTKTIERILIANNGLAAVRGIDSIRSWLYEHIRDQEAIEFAVLVTPEDLHANAEFISLADIHVSVPGGPSTNNYANVDLIVQTALQNFCDAIYPGWGHLSENPALPHECAKLKDKVTFLGPCEKAMFLLGNKIASTILAQSKGVPTVPWSGSGIRLHDADEYDEVISMCEKACVTSVEECEKVCSRIGFPLLIKASEGGGGKGIRRCMRSEDVRDMFIAVREEVEGCHIFVMRMLENVRHIEVQLLADNYGDCIALHTRECSVQRRHQKLVEEGPAFGVDPAIILEMEAAAILLIKTVKYRGLGTVEYMYEKSTGKFFFLELNPRIQVEHPVSELISGVNLPAALLCIGMGVPLHRVPEVRSFYGEEPYGTTPIDFARRRCLPPKGHTIAVRITAEDTDKGFQPTSGRVEEITFRNSKECWGYFSVGSGGEIHQFADSQFGHIFSSGETREEARRGMVLALRNLVIYGDIHNSASFVLGLLERKEFCECDINTAWLDRIIAERALQEPQQQDVHLAIIAACAFRLIWKNEENIAKYIASFNAGHVPSSGYLSNYETESYFNRSRKYTVSMGFLSPTEIAISLNNSVISVSFRRLNFGALQLRIWNKTFIAHVKKEPTGLRVSIGGKETTFTGDVDPTKIFSTVPGRLVRYVVGNESHVAEGNTIAEVEVMKMILPLRATTAGVLHHRVAQGSTIAVGTLIGEITPDDTSKVLCLQEALDQWPSALAGEKEKKMEHIDGLTRARQAVEALWNMLRGYHFAGIPLQQRLQAVFDNLSSLFLSSVALSALNFPPLSSAGTPESTDSLTEKCVEMNTPNKKLETVVKAFVADYIAVEQPFAGLSRQEAIQRLRETKSDSMEVYALDFAYHQPCHRGVLKALLSRLESNRPLLQSLQGTLSSLLDIHSMNDGSLALQVRYLLRQNTLPSFEERKAAFAMELEEGLMTDVIQGSYGDDIICAVIFDRQAPHLAQLCLELYIRREYFGECWVKNVDIFVQNGCWYGFYDYGPLEDHDPLHAENFSFSDDRFDTSTESSRGTGFCMIFPDEQLLRQRWTMALNNEIFQAQRELSVGTVFFAVGHQSTDKSAAHLCQQLLERHMETLERQKTLRRITFVVHGVPGGPHIFTYWQYRSWREDTLIRNIAPLSARRLELHRLENYDVAMYPTPFKEVHVFHAKPKNKKNADFLENRIFARVFLCPRDVGVDAWTEANEVDAGHMVAKCLSALEFARNDSSIKYPMYNHIFIKLAQLRLDVAGLRRTIEYVGKSYGRRMNYLGVSEVELSFNVMVSSGCIPFRVMITRFLSYNMTLGMYYEWIENGVICLRRAENSEDVILTAMSMSHDKSDDTSGTSTDAHSISSSGKQLNNTNNKISTRAASRTFSKLTALSTLLPSRDKMEALATEANNDEKDSIPLEPYPLLSEKSVRHLQATALGTMYVHDWPLLLDVLLRKQWALHAHGRGIQREHIPSRVLKATELFLDPADCETLSEKMPMDHVPCGMVAWLVDVLPPTYYNSETDTVESRRFVMVANDITHCAGSFSVPEDGVFYAASLLARRLGVPFVFISANSGARLGLSAEVKKRFRVAFSATNDVEYLYLLPEDYEEVQRLGVELTVEKIQHEGNGETRYVISGIIGAPNEDIGVENLRGSALIAGHMSKCYDEVPTISVVSGRSVGIGAYLNRLGSRVIQTGDSPIILTGSKALNRLLGNDVYSDNIQLGGKQVMMSNGVTHWCAKSNYDSAKILLRWLDYVPPVVSLLLCQPRTLALPHADPVDRDVTFAPNGCEAYDPRCLACGVGDALGFFDRGSWMECMEGWAKSVVTGRATLGGIPCGVVLVETRLTRKLNPADPADPTSVSSFTVQVGQVWFPDSARKTADALRDFHRERLPCFIFANWRGFSGGRRDMFDEVLKFGASIVETLREYDCPVFVYIPPHGELRGGAWVVVDPEVNHNGVVEMYCDPTARGGVMEPSAVVEVKFHENDLREIIRRNNPHLASMDPKRQREEENRLLPRYRNAAVLFADLHDTHVRMQAKGGVRGVVPWKDSRRIFHLKLQRKLKELSLAAFMVKTKKVDSLMNGVMQIEDVFAQEHPGIIWGTDDALHMQWLTEKEAENMFAPKSPSLFHDSISNFSTNVSLSSSMQLLHNDIEKLVVECKASGTLDKCFQRLFADKEVLNSAMRAIQNKETNKAELKDFVFDFN